MKNIVLIGMPGTGKSTVGKALAERFGYEFVDADDLIVQTTGKTLPEILRQDGLEAFYKIENKVGTDLNRTHTVIAKMCIRDSLVGAVYVCVRQVAWRTLAGNIPLLSPLLKAAMEHALLAYLLAGAAVLLVLLLYPFGRRAAKDQLQCIGLINHAGMPPDLLRKHRDKDNPRVTVWEFRNQGIPLQE